MLCAAGGSVRPSAEAWDFRAGSLTQQQQTTAQEWMAGQRRAGRKRWKVNKEQSTLPQSLSQDRKVNIGSTPTVTLMITTMLNTF